MIPKILKGASAQNQQQRQAELYRNLIRHEAHIGGQLFGPIPKGHRREFFCLDAKTWVWHEEWVDTAGVQRRKTTRYDIRPDSVLKAQDGQPYQKVSPEETRNLYQAALLYQQRIRSEIYNFV